MSEPDGLAIYGAWILIVYTAIETDRYGMLLRSDGEPHDADSIAAYSGCPDPGGIQGALDFLVRLGWLEMCHVGGQAELDLVVQKARTREEDELDAHVDKIATRIHKRHSKRKCSLKVARANLKSIIRGKKEKIKILEDIDRMHELWCSSQDWLKEGGMYQKSLDAWLAPSKERWKQFPVGPVMKTSGPRNVI